MRFTSILAPRRSRFAAFLSTVWLALTPALLPAQAQNLGDEAITQMKQAFTRGDKARLAALLPQTAGHPLEPWAAYWELKARLPDASSSEVQDFLQRWAGSYQEDRLRNDWLLLLGQRRQWDEFAQIHRDFRMKDDREVQCYAALIDTLRTGQSTRENATLVRNNWHAQRNLDDGCLTAADRFIASGALRQQDAWIKARLAAEAKRPAAARAAASLVAPESLPALSQALANPRQYLQGNNPATGRARQEAVTLALIVLAVADPDAAAAQLEDKWADMLTREERNWVWGVIGKQAAGDLSLRANGYFAKVTHLKELNDDMLGWKVRAALRTGQWQAVSAAYDAMSAESQQDPTWAYWKAHALLQLGGDKRRDDAHALLQSFASTRGFYEMLALEALGQPITTPAQPEPLTADEKASARANPALQRGLYAIGMGLRSEGVREWNYGIALHEPGGMNDRALLAAADLACQQQVWDRCINTSERTKSVIHTEQRFPMPFREAVIAKSQAIGLDPAYVYGLIRQESRFIMDARSHVGASGLMQVMPNTARWTARKIGLTDFTPDQINDRDTNITIGTAYLKLALDDFDGSMPLAAAAYNAGPGRPRNWRNGPVMDAAAWAENVPFTETRDYVKKVLANTTNYAALITGQPQSLRARLGQVGPRGASEPAPNKDLP